MLNTTVKNHEEIDRRYFHCAPYSKQWKSLKCSPLEKLESVLSALSKQACESNAYMDGTHLKENALHITAHLGIANFSASSGWIDRFKRRNIVYRTVR
jgi:centromere protein B